MSKKTLRISLNTTLGLGLGLCAWAGPAAAKTVKGPVLAVEQGAATAVEGGEKGVKPDDLTVAHRRYEVNLLVPVPVKALGGMLVAKVDLFKEQRDFTGKDAAGGQSVDVRNPNVAGWGAVFLPHASEGAPRFFVVLERYGYLSAKRSTKPMGEYILGADIADDDMPFHLKFSPSDDAESRVVLRLRRFPGFDKWLLLVGHKIETKSGFSIDAAIPSHLILGWQTEGADWKGYFGGRAVSREYPMDLGGDVRGWVEGFSAYGLLGARRRIKGPLFASLEAGAQKEAIDWHDRTGEIVQQYETKWGPFARLALEAWVQTP